jgi:hypothetical protein
MSQVVDQFAHFGQGVSIALPWAFPLPPVVAGGLSGGIGLFWRELSQLRRSNGFKQWKAELERWRNRTKIADGTEYQMIFFPSTWELWHMNDRLLDILFGVVGGAAVGIAIGVLR